MNLKSLLLLIPGVVGLVINFALLYALTLVGLLKPSIPMTDLLTKFQISGSSDLTNLGMLFDVWSMLVFTLVGTEGFVSLNFNISYVLYFAVFLISIVVLGFLSKNFKHALFSFVVFVFLSLIVSMLIALFVGQSLYLGPLSPADQQKARNVSYALVRLSYLVPFKAAIIGFGINTAIAMGILFGLTRKKK